MAETKLNFSYEFPRPSVATDCVIFGFDNRNLNILLIKRGVEPFKEAWAIPGGFLQENETVEQCAQRELKEETSLEVGEENIKQFHVFSAVDRDPRTRVLSVAFYALVKTEQVKGGTDADDAQWFPVNMIDTFHLAFDHKEIINMALEKLRQEVYFEPIIFRLMPDSFSMSDLQAHYEAILGVTFDRRNFSKKMLHYGMLDEVNGASRKHYKFNQQNYDALKQKKGFRLEF